MERPNMNVLPALVNRLSFVFIQDVLMKIVRKEGIPALWKGFTPCYLRIGPHTVLTFIFLEQFNVAARQFYGIPS